MCLESELCGVKYLTLMMCLRVWAGFKYPPVTLEEFARRKEMSELLTDVLANLSLPFKNAHIQIDRWGVNLSSSRLNQPWQAHKKPPTVALKWVHIGSVFVVVAAEGNWFAATLGTSFRAWAKVWCEAELLTAAGSIWCGSEKHEPPRPVPWPRCFVLRWISHPSLLCAKVNRCSSNLSLQ